MRDDVRRDLERSARAFREIVWPEISRYLGDGVLKSLETNDDEDLDRTAGFDAYQLLQTGIRTIAQRTQFLDDYRKPATFTVRFSRNTNAVTEYRKRFDALERGFDLPALVVQGYVLEQRQTFVRAAVTHGRAFYDYVFKYADQWAKRTTYDGNTFLVIPWVAISRDNAADRSEVPMLAKDGLGVVERTPDTFFCRRQALFDRDPRYVTDHRRDPNLLWI